MIEWISKDDTNNPVTNATGASTTTVVNLPVGVQDGDFLLALVQKNVEATNALTPPSGWTLITSQETTNLGIYAYYKFASGEGASYTWTIGGTASSWGAGIQCYRGVDPANPINTSATSTATTTADIAFPSITTTKDACQIVVARAALRNTGTPTGTGMTSADAVGDIVKTASYGTFDNVSNVQRYIGTFRTWTSTGGVANGNTSLLATANSYMTAGTWASWSSTTTQTIAVSALISIALNPEPPVYVQYGTRGGFMDVEHVGTRARYNTGSLSGAAAVTNVDGLAVDDYMLATLVTNNDTITPPSGWTLLYQDIAPVNAWRTEYYYKWAVTADVSAGSFSWNVANTVAAPTVIILSAFRHVDFISPVNTSAVTTGTTAGTVNAADVTTTAPCAVIHLVTQRRSSGTPPNYSCGTAGFVEMADVTNVGTVGYSAATYWWGQNKPTGLVSGPSLISADATNQTDYARRTIALRAQLIDGPVMPFNSSVHRSSRW